MLISSLCPFFSARTHNLSARYKYSNANTENPIAGGRRAGNLNAKDIMCAPPLAIHFDAIRSMRAYERLPLTTTKSVEIVLQNL